MMIKENELMKGNIVEAFWSRTGFAKCKVETIGSMKAWVSALENHHNIISPNEIKYDDLHPIPLTAEILENCGFEKESLRLDVHVKSVIYSFRWYSRIKVASLFCNEIPMEIDSKYLHQLQNLYFALTGEELNVQLTTSLPAP